MSIPHTKRVTGTASTGFTLVELMVTLAVATILLMIATPSFLSIITNNRLTTQTNEMVTFFSLARSEAVNRRTEVRVVPTDPADWSQGLSVITDANKDGDFTDSEDLLRLSSPLEGESILTADAENNLTNPYVAFNSRGALQPVGDTFAYQLTAPACTGSETRIITVATTGRISASRLDCP